MDRAIPVSSNEEIDLYMRTYYSVLRSSGEVQVRSLEETHSGMNASLHQGANGNAIDVSAFVYSSLRLPVCAKDIRLVLLGQSAEVFTRRGYPHIETWSVVQARARRRKMFFDDHETLAVFINSISDIDDLVPMLTTYQIEWNKMHQKFTRYGLLRRDNITMAEFKEALELDDADFAKLKQVWGEAISDHLMQVVRAEKRFALRMLAGSRTDYRRATQGWWQHAMRHCGVPNVHDRPVYFVSSNMHALPNLLGGYAHAITDTLYDFLEMENPEGLVAEYHRLNLETQPGQRENLFYYLLRQYLASVGGEAHAAQKTAHELSHGIHNVLRPFNLDVGVQVVELSQLDPSFFDPRLNLPDADWTQLRHSEALIVNIDYPLGMAAYEILAHVSANVGVLKGVYILGKAATLNGRVGDVMIPNVLHDEHSRNTYLFSNCFCAGDVAPYLGFGTVLDNQKAVTVRGTFLQNKQFMHLFYKEGYTDIEMEAGPYLSAMYENISPKRYPVNEIVKVYAEQPYDIGVLHYASDTPYSKRQSLLSKSLLYFGMDSSYATAVAILRRIFSQELGITSS